ncbi:tRNA1(Val) (adenine(37)-N6)-methyltransferase [Sodalis ligni]|uniref:tRNA1(Val) (adenine(37)-N6)-methyltransferase n=1 Tax=Sodalis ligni TaxID=2697027 RepID=A0A4R1NIB4_9GAMM|nr:methyltransferase [Sodalis ligni]TCL06827.1 tRNA1Val (adenine37-N6)-methyltransferase [Sodalis ligni]
MMESPGQKTLLRRDGFTFKYFFAAHDRCAMKVGTDGVLLGAWTPLCPVPRRILDIGTGCGLIALMLAQRTGEGTAIDALELDGAAAAQAGENCARSPWAARLRVINDNILTYALTSTERYELIVSNPPYFPVGIPCRDTGRDRARSTGTLTHEHLLDAARRLLAPEGLFMLVLPLDIGEGFIRLARRQRWHVRYRTEVADNPGKPPHRILLGLSTAAGASCCSAFTLRDENRAYSAAYRDLTRDFYLGL